MQLLALDTSTECCSAALLRASGEILLRSVVLERGHAEIILPMVDDLLTAASLRLADLDGIAFGRGPGAFTGLRIAAGVVQGLAIGAGLRVVPVSSLAAVAELVPADAAGSILVCNDARMGEIYWARFGRDASSGALVAESPEGVSAPDRVVIGDGVRHIVGNALPRHPQLLERALQLGLRSHEGIYPRADAVARLGARLLAAGGGVSAADALPSYVRDDVARPAGGAVTGMS